MQSTDCGTNQTLCIIVTVLSAICDLSITGVLFYIFWTLKTYTERYVVFLDR